MTTIAHRLDEVRRRIARAAQAAGRSPEEVTLVAVSKGHPAEAVRQAYDAGARLFGENYVQELRQKRASMPDLGDLEFHLIGHLQRNKVRDALEAANCIETVDSVRLAEEIARRAPAGRRVSVLVQVNVGQEPQKAGVAPGALPELLDRIRTLAALDLRGLMTVPPADDDPERARPHFRALRRLAERHLGDDAWLSMGMSHDLEVAIAEGATHVRVGTAIFGPRTRP